MPLYLVTEFTPKIAAHDEFIILCPQIPDLSETAGFIVQIPVKVSKATGKQISGIGEFLAEVQHGEKSPDFLWTKAQVNALDPEENPKLVVTKMASAKPSDITNGVESYFHEYFK